MRKSTVFPVSNTSLSLLKEWTLLDASPALQGSLASHCWEFSQQVPGKSANPELISTKVSLSDADSEWRGLDRSCQESVDAPATPQSLDPGPLGGTASSTTASGLLLGEVASGTFPLVEGQ